MIKKVVLQNGLRLLIIPESQSVAATALVLVEAGSEYETKNINGLSHFLEHMVFKGTTNRPAVGQVSQELESLGAQYNAFTGNQYTGYWAKVQARKASQVLDIVSDLYLNPLFVQDEIDKERGVIIEEINYYEDQPARRVQEFFTELLYGDQPAGWPIAGEKDVIRTLNREDFVQYRNLHYVPSKTVVVVAGNVDAGKVTAQVKKLFGSLPKARKIQKSKTTEKQTAPAVLVKHKQSDQSHFVLGVRAFSIFDKRRYASAVLADVLGGGMSSRLFRRVRDELGAAYYVGADDDLSLDHGSFQVAAGVDHAKLEAVLSVVVEEMRRLTKELVRAEELQKTKDHMTGNLLLSLESSHALANFYGMQEILTGRGITPKELIRRIQAVTAEEVRSLARSIFVERHMNLAMIGPYEDSAPFKKFLKL